MGPQYEKVRGEGVMKSRSNGREEVKEEAKGLGVRKCS